MDLIPKPSRMKSLNGSFTITEGMCLGLTPSCDGMILTAVRALRQEISTQTGIHTTISKWDPSGIEGGVRLRKDQINLSYRLSVGENGIEVTGSSSEGLYYGVQTLRQLVRINGSRIPCLIIEDSPAFRSRGFYHDVTRGKVPNPATLMELADRLSFYKMNQLQLNIEHSFAFRPFSEVWVDSDPLTAEEILEFDEYCSKRNIELIPSLSTFGHLYHILMSESFRHLNELEADPSVPFTWADRMAHHTINAADPESIRLVCGMIDEYLPLFRSGKFNICCDETFDLGEGKNRELAQKIGKGRLYLDFAKQIISYVENKGKRVMMWGDILIKYPEMVKELPAGVILLNWDYSPAPRGEGVRMIAETGLEQYVCPGVHGWNKLMNDMDSACSNIRSMISHGIRHRAAGVCNTDWGDFGHINLFSNSIPGMIYGAALSWNTEGAQNLPEFDANISRLEYGDLSGRVAGLLRELSRERMTDWETIVLWYYSENGLSTAHYGYENYYRKAILECREDQITRAYNRIRELQNELSDLYAHVYESRKQDMREFLVSAGGLALLQALLLVIKKYSLKQEINSLVLSPGVLAEKLEYWFTTYKEVWRARNKESELYRIKEVVMGICRMLRKFEKE